MRNIKKNISFIIISLIFLSCASNREWTNASISNKDGEITKLEISPKKYSYFSYIEARENKPKEKYTILLPEDVEYISADSLSFVSIFFDEDRYGIESHSFAKTLSGSDLIIAYTKFRKKTCACKGSGSLYKAYFIIFKNKHIIIKENKKKEISNKKEVFDFIDAHSKIPISRDINNLDGIIDFITKIQNL